MRPAARFSAISPIRQGFAAGINSLFRIDSTCSNPRGYFEETSAFVRNLAVPRHRGREDATVYASHGVNLCLVRGLSFRFKSSLAQQFLLVAFAVMVVGMLAMGVLVSKTVERSVAEVNAASAALYINNFIAPHLQELASSDKLSEQGIQNLRRALAKSAVVEHVTSVKIWKRDGLIVYSSEPALIGRTFPLNPNPRKAWSGAVATEFDDLFHEEDATDRATGLPLLEIFAPVRDSEHGNVIAVVEFHERGEALEAELAEAEWRIWISTAFITLVMTGVLFSIVAKGSRTIDEQRAALTERVAQLSELLHQNCVLRSRVERAARKATEDNERLIRRLGYDLHDGIAQLIGLALLRLDRVQGAEKDRDNLTKIQRALEDAINDIRNVCRGLLLPEIQECSLRDALNFMIRHHERSTSTMVTCGFGDLPEESPKFVKIALCRFVQEALNNAFKHAGGQGQKVSATWDSKTIIIEVADDGPGMSAADEKSSEGGFGLTGLRDRLESIGGELIIDTAPGAGTRIVASIPSTFGASDGE
jgi:signal transduction histidine kinase